MAQWTSSGESGETSTSAGAPHRPLLDAVLAAARFERGVRRARHVRIDRGRDSGTRNAGIPLALAARELRRLTRAPRRSTGGRPA
ncbi:MAG: hypothetical protein QOH62_2946 [Solirubrobacteraceae bacterium]|jgi:hypothetical protein|nr:hypothetical protein [Solirubrobacteraceae bacterium]